MGINVKINITAYTKHQFTTILQEMIKHVDWGEYMVRGYGCGVSTEYQVTGPRQELVEAGFKVPEEDRSDL